MSRITYDNSHKLCHHFDLQKLTILAGKKKTV